MGDRIALRGTGLPDVVFGVGEQQGNVAVIQSSRITSERDGCKRRLWYGHYLLAPSIVCECRDMPTLWLSWCGECPRLSRVVRLLAVTPGVKRGGGAVFGGW